MSHPYSYGNQVKDKARTLALPLRGSPSRVHLCLPARECLCIIKALERGVINKQTAIIFAESDKGDFPKVQAKLASLGFKSVYGHYGEIQKLDLSHALGQLGKAYIDSAFIDLCGEYTPSVGRWLHDSRDYFYKGAIVSLTTQTNGRYYTRHTYRGGAEGSIDRLKNHYKITTRPEYCGQKLIPEIHEPFGEYTWRTECHTADCWAAMFHADMCGKPTKRNNHYFQQFTYRAPKPNKQNMTVTTIII